MIYQSNFHPVEEEVLKKLKDWLLLEKVQVEHVDDHVLRCLGDIAEHNSFMAIFIILFWYQCLA